MYISRIDINNYRLLKNTRIDCEKELSLVIGKNNCGKTSLLSALNKCVGNKVDIGKFEYFDFSLSFQNKLFNVVKERDVFLKNDIKGIQIDLYIEYNNNDNLSNIRKLLLDLDPNNNTVVLRFMYSLRENLSELIDDFNKYKIERNGLQEKDNFTKFMEKRLNKYFEFKKYSILYDCKNKNVDEDTYKYLDNKDVDISKIIAFKFVSAKREVSNAGETELSLLASIYYSKTKNPDENSVTAQNFENAVDKTDEDFNKIYSTIFEPLTQKISQFGGIKKNDTTLQVISQIQAMKLLKDNTTVVYNDQSDLLPENFNGLGYLNLFSIIMNIEIELNDFRKESKKDELPADINILFIEEPEAHTHPQMQYIFIRNIKSLLKEGRKLKNNKEINLQTIITTHSSHIVAESDFNDIKYFVKNTYEDGYNTISKNLKELEIIYQKETGTSNNHFKFLKQYLTLNRSEVFFSDKIILIEGDTERILLPAMMKKLDQYYKFDVPLLSQNISVIEVGNYSEIYSDFINFIDIKTLIITDIDIVKKEIQKDKNGKSRQVSTACPVDQGTYTSNSSLKFFLDEKLKLINDDKTEKDVLTGLSIEDKIIKYNNEDSKSKWKSDINGRVLIVYQTPELGRDNVVYNARSFEDAFFHINIEFFINPEIKNNKEAICEQKFQGLKNVEYLFDNTKSSYYLAENCVNKKPSLAMDILLNSDCKDNKDFTNWKTPKYIEEGLIWLQKD